MLISDESAVSPSRISDPRNPFTYFRIIKRWLFEKPPGGLSNQHHSCPQNPNALHSHTDGCAPGIIEMNQSQSFTIILRGREIPYHYITSDRHSLAIEVKRGEVYVRAPKRMSHSYAEQFLRSKQNWILQKLQEASHPTPAQEKSSSLSDQTKAELEKRYREAARRVITERVAYYHQFTGGDYHTIAIREQKTRWGSCSARGTLSFHWKLILAPPVVLDYVVVHELCHLTHMNHSKDFWNMVSSVMPDYQVRRKWLKVHGSELAETYEPIPFSNV